jgi:ketopantoate reductase
MDDTMRITVLGAGAMGEFYDAQLSEAGADVLLLDV